MPEPKEDDPTTREKFVLFAALLLMTIGPLSALLLALPSALPLASPSALPSVRTQLLLRWSVSSSLAGSCLECSSSRHRSVLSLALRLAR